mgnify:FL=1
MKRFALALLMSFCACCALQAQDTKSDIMSYLRNEGYAPSYDSDGDVMFKINGNVYYALVRDNGDYSLVEVRAQFRTEGKSLSELYQIANDFNLNTYLCKCSAYRNSKEENVCTIGMEFITSSASMTNYQIGHILQLIPGCVDELLDKL